jgi:transcriptional regulator with XRE-family HTH domain
MGLIASGFNDSQIARTTGVSRGTVGRWRRSSVPPSRVLRSLLADRWCVLDGAAYAYLLGAYLGDGTVCIQKGAWLQVVNDRRYPQISREIRKSMEITFPGRLSRSCSSTGGESDVLAISHPAVVKAFPQHGPGRKHLRSIILTDWQLELTHAHPEALIRGLIHSDGCRAINRFRTKLPSGRVAQYEYVRYFFSNLSDDIRRIFREHCERLGIRVTQSNHRNLTVSHRDSVSLLEQFVGPKR